LADQYGFRYVVAQNFIALELPRVLQGAAHSLYAIPKREPDP